MIAGRSHVSWNTVRCLKWSVSIFL
jgi:hypothetical protein